MNYLKKLGVILTTITIVNLQSFSGPIEDAKNYIQYEKYNKATDILRNFLLNVKLKESEIETANFYLGRALIFLNELNEAKKVYQNVLTLVPASAVNMVGLGSVLLLEGNINEAQTLFDNAILQTKSKNIEVYTALAFAYSYKKAKNVDAKFAQTKFSTIHEKAKKNAEFHIAMGDFFKRLKYGNEAYTNYQLALSIEPNNTAAKYRLAKLYLNQSNKEMFEQNMIEVTLIDKNYAPAFYDLYLHFYNIDVSRAKEYFLKYKNLTENNPSLEFEEANVLFASKDFQKSLDQVLKMIATYQNKVDLRCYRLAGYAYHKLNDSLQTINYLDTFFTKADPEDVNIENYRLMASTLAKFPTKLNDAAKYIEKAYIADTVPSEKITDLKTMITYYKRAKNTQMIAYWSGVLYQTNYKQSPTDLFNWGVATLQADDNVKADSIFGLYIDKYPNEYFGYLWKARTRYMLDTPSHETALPFYTKTIEFALKDTVKYKNILLESYGVLFDNSRKKKNYEESLKYVELMLIYKSNDQELLTEKNTLSKYLDEMKKIEERKKGKSSNKENTVNTTPTETQK